MVLKFSLLLKLILQIEIWKKWDVIANTMQDKYTKNQENTEEHKFYFYPVIGFCTQ